MGCNDKFIAWLRAIVNIDLDQPRQGSVRKCQTTPGGDEDVVLLVGFGQRLEVLVRRKHHRT